MSKIILTKSQIETVNKLEKREENLKAYTNVLADTSIFYGKTKRGKKVCIMELIKRNRAVKQYKIEDIEKSIYNNTNLPKVITSLISEFIYDGGTSKYYNLTLKKDNDVKINTNIIVIKELNDHVWKDIHKKFFKQDLKITFVKNNSDIDKISANNFKKANKYDIVFIRDNIFSNFYKNDKYNNGYYNTSFRFNRVIFSNIDKLKPIKSCPLADFTWCITSDLDTYTLENDQDIYPVSKRSTIWNNSFNYDKDFYKQANVIISDIEYVHVDLRISIEHLNRDKYVSTAKMLKEAYNDPVNNKKFLVIVGSKYYNYLKTDVWYSKSTKTISENHRFDEDKFLQSCKNSIVVKNLDLANRTDLNLNCITDIILLDPISSFCSITFGKKYIERCIKINKTSQILKLTIISHKHELKESINEIKKKILKIFN